MRNEDDPREPYEPSDEELEELEEMIARELEKEEEDFRIDRIYYEYSSFDGFKDWLKNHGIRW